MKAVNIDWDVDEIEDLDYLPTEIEIPKRLKEIEEISDYISDETGFCHKGFKIIEEREGYYMSNEICKGCRYNNENFILDCDDGEGNSHYECPYMNLVEDGYGGCECTNHESPMSSSDIAMMISKIIYDEEIENIEVVNNIVKVYTIDRRIYTITVSDE